MPLILPLILASAVPPPLPHAKVSRAPQAVPAEPAVTDEQVWALARKAGSPAAYTTYLNRFPDGGHQREAIDAAIAAGAPIISPPAMPPAPPAPPPPPVPARAYITPCVSLLVDQALKKVDSEEARAYLAAQSGNRVADYQAYLSQFPAGACRGEATAAIEMRAERRLRFKPIAGFGPLAPQRLVRQIIGGDDYPPSALRNGEQGLVVAEWDVAEDGIPESCHIVRSSDSAALDDATCRYIARRLKYDPARDSAGKPIRSADHMSVRWSLPDESPPSAKMPDKASK